MIKLLVYNTCVIYNRTKESSRSPWYNYSIVLSLIMLSLLACILEVVLSSMMSFVVQLPLISDMIYLMCY